VKYEWRFDKRGRRTVPLTPTKEMASPSSTARSPAEELEAVFQWIDSHPQSGLEFSTLESMRVLPSPPAWSYVQKEIKKLRDTTSTIPVETRAEIEESVAACFKAFRENAEGLENVVYCGTVLSTFYDEQRPETISWALELLGRSLSRGRTREECLRILKIIRDKLAEAFHGEKELEAQRVLLRAGHIEQWLNSVEKIQRDLVDAVRASEKNDKYEAATLAWKTWREWAIKVWPRPPKVSEFDIWNLATRAAYWPPGSVLSDDPTIMTIREWTNAFLSSFHGNCSQAQEWFTPFALVRLGFPSLGRLALINNGSLESRLSDPKSLPEELYRFYARIPQSTSRGSTLIVLESPWSGGIDNWLPWIEMGCLACQEWQVTEALEALEALNRMSDSKCRYVFFGGEYVPNPNKVEERVSLFSGWKSRYKVLETATPIFLGHGSLTRGDDLPYYYLQTPSSLEEAVRHLEALPPEALLLRTRPADPGTST